MTVEVGTKLEGKVTGITHFGAFVELPGGVKGLIHISEIADNYVKDVNDHLKINDTIMVKVISVDEKGKIGLSIKQAVDKCASEQKFSKTTRPDRPAIKDGRSSRYGHENRNRGGRKPLNFASFEDKMSRFLKDSEERISSLKKNTESKRGGRGTRRI